MSQSHLVFYYHFNFSFMVFRRNNMLLIYLTNKKGKVNRKRKYLLSRKLVGKKYKHGFNLRKGQNIGGRKCYLMMFLKSFGKKRTLEWAKMPFMSWLLC